LELFLKVAAKIQELDSFIKNNLCKFFSIKTNRFEEPNTGNSKHSNYALFLSISMPYNIMQENKYSKPFPNYTR